MNMIYGNSLLNSSVPNSPSKQHDKSLQRNRPDLTQMNSSQISPAKIKQNTLQQFQVPKIYGGPAPYKKVREQRSTNQEKTLVNEFIKKNRYAIAASNEQLQVFNQSQSPNTREVYPDPANKVHWSRAANLVSQTSSKINQFQTPKAGLHSQTRLPQTANQGRHVLPSLLINSQQNMPMTPAGNLNQTSYGQGIGYGGSGIVDPLMEESIHSYDTKNEGLISGGGILGPNSRHNQTDYGHVQDLSVIGSPRNNKLKKAHGLGGPLISTKSGNQKMRKSHYMLLGYQKVEDILQNYNSSQGSQRLDLSVRIPAEKNPNQMSMEGGGDQISHPNKCKDSFLQDLSLFMRENKPHSKGNDGKMASIGNMTERPSETQKRIDQKQQSRVFQSNSSKYQLKQAKDNLKKQFDNCSPNQRHKSVLMKAQYQRIQKNNLTNQEGGTVSGQGPQQQMQEGMDSSRRLASPNDDKEDKNSDEDESEYDLYDSSSDDARERMGASKMAETKLSMSQNRGSITRQHGFLKGNQIPDLPGLPLLTKVRGAERYRHDDKLYQEKLIEEGGFAEIADRYQQRKEEKEKKRKGFDFTDMINRGYVIDGVKQRLEQIIEQDQRDYLKVKCDDNQAKEGQEVDLDGKPIKKSKMNKLVDDETTQKNMYLPNKQLAVNKFGQKLVEGIIKLHVDDNKFEQRVLDGKEQHMNNLAREKLALQAAKGKPEVTKAQLAEKKLKKVKKISSIEDLDLVSQSTSKKGDDLVKQPTGIAGLSDLLNKQEVDKSEDLFQKRNMNKKFYKTAKAANLNGDKDAALLEFFQECTVQKVTPLPIFSGIQNGQLQVIGQFISDGMANATSKLLKERAKMTDSNGQPYVIKQVILDENWLKDESSAKIFEAILSYDSIEHISYSNNELGPKTVNAITKILYNPALKKLGELRITGVKGQRQYIGQLIDALNDQSVSKMIRKLKLSFLPLKSDTVLFKNLIRIPENNPSLLQLNLSHLGLVSTQLATLMTSIADFTPSLRQLDLSNNPLSVDLKNEPSQFFCVELMRLIEFSENLQHINLNNMNLGEHILKLMWPMANSTSLVAIHISNNEIPVTQLAAVFAAFNIKTIEGDLYDQQKFVRVEPVDVADILRRQTKKAISDDNIEKNKKMDFQQILNQHKQDSVKKEITVNSQFLPLKSEIDVQTFEQATVKIVNMEVCRQVNSQKFVQQTQKDQGFGHTSLAQQPLVFQRKLGHPELVFNDTRVAATHFDAQAPQKWRLASKDIGCWVCNQWKYCIIFVDRTELEKNYEAITDSRMIKYLHNQYKIKSNPRILVQNKNAPLIMGSVTNFVPIQMASIAMFNMHLDQPDVPTGQQNKRSEHSAGLLALEKGIKSFIGAEVQKANCRDWRERLIDHMPYQNVEDSLMINIPEKFNPYAHTHLPQDEINRRFDDSDNKIFVYADYLKPGRHQIVIYDQRTDTFFAKNIVVDLRKCDPIEPQQKDKFKPIKSLISRMQVSEGKDKGEGEGKILIDLDNSVFRNFQRMLLPQAEKTLQNDSRFWIVDQFITNEADYEEVVKVLTKNFRLLTEILHSMAVQKDRFPFLRVADFSMISNFFVKKPTNCPESEAPTNYFRKDQVENAIQDTFKKYQTLRPEADLRFKMKRMHFLEVLLIFIGEIYIRPQVKLTYAEAIVDVCKSYINPAIDYPKSVEMSMRVFRTNNVWEQEVNSIIACNLKGIIILFYQFMTSRLLGFNIESAKDLLLKAQIQLDFRTIKIQFDLAQMAVLDEHLGAAEYEDMELVEFYEFLVRIAYVAPIQWTDEDKLAGMDVVPEPIKPESNEEDSNDDKKSEITDQQNVGPQMAVDQRLRRLMIKLLSLTQDDNSCEFVEPAAVDQKHQSQGSSTQVTGPGRM